MHRSHNILFHAAGMLPIVFGAVIACNDSPKAFTPSSVELRALDQQAHSGDITDISFAPDGKTVVTASRDGNVRIWNTTTGTLMATLHHTDQVNSAKFSPDGTRIVTASNDDTAQLWTAKGDRIATLPHSKIVNSAEFSVDGNLIVTVGNDQIAKLWEGTSGFYIHSVDGPITTYSQGKFSFDGSKIITSATLKGVNFEHKTNIWNVSNGSLFRSLPGQMTYLSPDSHKFMIMAADLKSVEIRNTDTGDLIGAMPLTNKSTFLGAPPTFSPDSKRIIGHGYPEDLDIWDAETGVLQTTSENLPIPFGKTGGHSGLLQSQLSVNQGQVLVYYGSGYQQDLVTAGAFIVDLKTNALLATLPPTSAILDTTPDGTVLFAGVTLAKYSPDGHQVIAAYGNGQALLYTLHQ